MKYLLILLFLAAVASIEFFHELSSNAAPVALMCTASSESMYSAGQDVLQQHLHSHH